MTTVASAALCPRCAAELPPESLVCPSCGVFVHIARLEEIAAEAMPLEPINPLAASMKWRECLELIPHDSPQYEQLRNRIGILAAGLAPAVPIPHHNRPMPTTEPLPAPPDSAPVAIFKTVGSMVVSIAVYYFLLFHDWYLAAGFVVLMLVHEMGHVAANWYYGISASPPIFVPFLGAVINLRQRPPNAKVEAIIGIGGPIAGTIGALICYVYFLQTGSALALYLSWFGFMLNLFNLLPVPPLDGGRITAAVSPWIWMLGLGGLVWMLFNQFSFILVMLLVYALPRIQATLRGRDRFDDYYKISRRSSWAIGFCYVALGAMLLYLYHRTAGMVRWE